MDELMPYSKGEPLYGCHPVSYRVSNTSQQHLARLVAGGRFELPISSL